MAGGDFNFDELSSDLLSLGWLDNDEDWQALTAAHSAAQQGTAGPGIPAPHQEQLLTTEHQVTLYLPSISTVFPECFLRQILTTLMRTGDATVSEPVQVAFQQASSHRRAMSREEQEMEWLLDFIQGADTEEGMQAGNGGSYDLNAEVETWLE